MEASRSSSSESEKPSKTPEKKRKKRKSKTAKVLLPEQATPFMYKSTTRVQSECKTTIFGIQFNNFFKDAEAKVFAAVGGRYISVYQCDGEATHTKLLQCYKDENEQEDFFCCAWSYTTDSALIVAAGKLGIIHVLQTTTMQAFVNFKHPGEVNDLKVHRRSPYLLFSASSDRSIKLWNIQTKVLVAIFSGVDGHRDIVITCNINLTCSFLVSGGVDAKICVWDLRRIETHINKSCTFDRVKCGKNFPTYAEHFPIYSTRDIHSNYVDCAVWFGEFIISKSCEEDLIIWKPSLEDPEKPPLVIRKFTVESCEYWFMRFTIDSELKWLALGNAFGAVYLWDLDVEDPDEIMCYKLKSPKPEITIRQISFSRDSKIMVCACDNGVIKRFDVVETQDK